MSAVKFLEFIKIPLDASKRTKKKSRRKVFAIGGMKWNEFGFELNRHD